MNTYKQFHGEIPVNEIGKELRKIAGKETAFKIMTGYGSSTGNTSASKSAALRSLRNMRKEGLIAAYIPGEKCAEVSSNKNDPYIEVRKKYKDILRTDRDAVTGNDGIIFIFVK